MELTLDLANLLHEFTPTSYGVWTGVLMFLAWMAREWRETRKLSSEDRLARREGYAKQVESLQKENRALRSDLRKVEREHDEYRQLCLEENSSLRRAYRTLEDHVAGLERQLTAAGIAVIRNLRMGVVSDEVQAASARAERYHEERQHGGRDDESEG